MKEELEKNAESIWRRAVHERMAAIYTVGNRGKGFFAMKAAIARASTLSDKEPWALACETTIKPGVCVIVAREAGEFTLGTIGHGSAELFGAPTTKELHWAAWDSWWGREVFKLLCNHGWNINYHGHG